MIALDASALLAFLFRDEGHEAVTETLASACISTVNLAEVLGRFARDGTDPDRVAGRLTATALEVVPFSSVHATTCADLYRRTQALGLSLGDRVCLALAAERRVAAMTADRAWSRLDLGIDIRLTR